MKNMIITKKDFFGFLCGVIVMCSIVSIFLFGCSKVADEDMRSDEQVDEIVEEIARKELGIGSVGSDVVEVQNRLVELDIYDIVEFNDDEKGWYGEQTQYYVTLFQLSQDIEPTGVVDQETWTVFSNPTIPSTEKVEELKEYITIDDGFDKDDIYYSPTFQKVAYLTFDDGPHPIYTKEIIDVLEKYNASATFFALGQNVDKYQEIVKEAGDNDRNVANHTYNHINISEASESDIRKEITDTSDTIVRVTAKKPTCFRPPYGAIAPEVRNRIDTAGISVKMWDVDPQDWRNPGADMIVDHVVSYTQNGEIILLHDGGGNREQTVIALENILKKMTADGWVFKSLPCV